MLFLALGALAFGGVLGCLLPAPAFLIVAAAATGVGIASAVYVGASLAYLIGATLCVVVLTQLGFASSLALQAWTSGLTVDHRKREAVNQRLAAKAETPEKS